ncbi:diphthine synthase [Candidatus Micrarchaeota archaeon]|nr:diphthine synthase [Candidatus Micrarchaeota archaeon]
MLYLIGLGLNPPASLSREALEAIRNSDVVFLEAYTGYVTEEEKKAIEKETGKKIQVMNREIIESGSILPYAMKNNACLLVPGDPLAATTHADLLLKAREKKIRFRVVHNSSILTAIGESGLQLYRFGRTSTIARWQKNFQPTSFASAITDNQKANLHTLLLADTHEGMQPAEAMETLEKACKAEGVALPERLVICSKLGKEDATINYTSLEEAKKLEARLPFCIIVPAALNTKEKELLDSIV